jgi:hypothetical protein
MRKLHSLGVLVPVVAIAAAAAVNCSPYSPDLGNTPYLCADTEPKCPDDYACMDNGAGKMVCVSAGGMAPDAGSGSSGFQCAADGPPLEPNDTKDQAYVTDVSPTQSRKYGPIAICPETDRDHFQINVTLANKGIQAITEWDSGSPVSVSILNAAGSSIGNGVAMGDKALRACVPNLPVGTYYAAAFGTAKNNYKIELKLIDACQ